MSSLNSRLQHLVAARLDRTLADLLEAPRLPPDAPLAVFDADGTLWDGDIGDDLFTWFVQEGRVHPGLAPVLEAALPGLGLQPVTDPAEALRQVLTAYEHNRVPTLAAYELMVWSMAGHSDATLRGWAHARVGQAASIRVRPAMMRCLERLRAAGIACHVISASNRWSLAAWATPLGFAPDELHGIDLESEEGRLRPRLKRPASLAEGKVAIAKALARSLGGERPLLGFGDSRFDLPMLRAVVHSFVTAPGDVLSRELEAGALPGCRIVCGPFD